MSDELRAALKSGVLTEDQLRELISLRAEPLQLSLEQALDAWKAGMLPKTARGDDLSMLISLLLTPASA